MKRSLFVPTFLAILGGGGCATTRETPPVTPAPVVTQAPIVKEPAAKTDERPSSSDRIYPIVNQPKTTLRVNGQKITAWVMDDPSERQEGMMFLSEKDVKAQEGMIFVFPDTAPRSFWMRNTLIPLDIVYIQPDGKVANVVRGNALDETPLPSAKPAKYVLELKGGEAGKAGIRSGIMIDGLKGLKASL